jgi:dihydropteroate synthase
LEDNYHLLQNLNAFQILELPILVGISRKSMIYKLLNRSPEESLNGTTALHIVALQNGASILRVHDVAAAREVLTIFNQLHHK